MERFQKLFLVIVMIFAAISSKSVLQLSTAQTICNMPVAGLMACKPSVTPPNPTAPTSDCCSALSHADMKCLCSYKNSKLLPSLGIDPKLAVKLPAKCNLPHPANC